MKRKIFYIIIGLVATLQSFSQTDTEFWFAAPEVTSQHSDNPIFLRFTTYAKDAIITIDQPANASFTPIIINLVANATYSLPFTAYKEIIENKPSNTELNYGIRITATASISAYYEIASASNPEIFPLKGNVSKGLDFIIPGQTRYYNQTYVTFPAHDGFAIVATEDNTTININLTRPDVKGNTKITVRLNKGQTYAVNAYTPQAPHSIGGSSVTSDKPICVTVYDDSIVIGGWDLIGDQIVPTKNTGKKFIAVRGELSAPGFFASDFCYIWPTEDNTEIIINGTPLIRKYNRGESFEFQLSDFSAYITTDKNVYIFQLTGTGTEAAATSLPSIECTGSQSVSFVRPSTGPLYLNILCKTADIGNFSIKGDATLITSSMFSVVPGSAGIWQFARINISSNAVLNALINTNDATSITNSTGLFHLGFLNSSGGGSRLGYFSNYSKLAMAPNLISSACLGSDIQLAAKQLNNVIYKWTGPNNFTSSIYNPVIPKSTIKDSGYYYVEATVPGCGTSLDSIRITVNPTPTIQMGKSMDTVCLGGSKPIQFNLTGKAPWNVVYSNGITNDTLKNIKSTTASFLVSPTSLTIYKFKNIIDSNACTLDIVNQVADTMKVNQLPIANFIYAGVHCEKNDILFTNQSTANLDQVVKWNWDMGNGTKLNLLNGNPFNHKYAIWGKDTVKLSVESSLGCKSDTLVKVIEVKPLPVVGFTIPNVCLDGGLASFKDTSSNKAGASSFSYYWNFNAGATPINPGPTFSASEKIKANPSVLYNTGGNYSVQLNVTSSDGCVDSLTQSFTINGSNPIANFKILKDTALCSNEEVVIKDSSWVYPGKVGVLRIVWGDGKDTTITDSKIGNLYKHFYGNAVGSNNFNYAIKVQAYSGGTCYDDSIASIAIVKPPTNVSLQADKDYVCLLDSLLIRTTIIGGVTPFNYTLNTDNTNSIIKGDYIYGVTKGRVNMGVKVVDAKNCIYNFSNLLSISLAELPIASLIIKDTVICNGDSVTLKGQGANLYKWYMNSNLSEITTIDSLRIGKAGNYSLVVNDGKCNSLPTKAFPIIEFTIPAINISYNLLSCTNGDVFIQTNAAEKFKIHYAWNFGDSSYFYKANPISHSYSKVGKYVIKLNVTNDYCPKYEYILIGDTLQVIDPITPKDFTLFVLADQDTVLSPKRLDPNYTQYTWIPAFNLSNPNIPNPIFNSARSTVYTLQILDPLTGCKILDIYKIDVSNEVVVAVPKAFTPNRDNLNDILKIEAGAGVKMLKSFIIFNRFGKIVFQTNDMTKGWDGKYNGYDQEMDAYSYLIDYVTYKDVSLRKTGSFILMR